MDPRQSAYRGCLLGLAVGDALGYTVHSYSLAEIRENYGPNGLLGYDLVNGYADVTSYTQLAAFTCNGILLALTQGQLKGSMSPFVNYIRLGQREWSASQQRWGLPDRTFCWLVHRKEICRRRCMDTWMMDVLGRKTLGTPEEPMNRLATPGAITAAVGVGLSFRPGTLSRKERDRLGAEAVALTHGSPKAFLSGAFLANLVSRTLWEPEKTMLQLVEDTLEEFRSQFEGQYGQTEEICAQVKQAIALSGEKDLRSVEAMERLRCENCAQILAGAVYAALISGEDPESAFDTAMIVSVNHSGASAAVGAVTGAILGARLGEDALPAFYLEHLEPVDVLRELADDLYQGCPLEKDDVFYDVDWDRKYLHGGK